MMGQSESWTYLKLLPSLHPVRKPTTFCCASDLEGLLAMAASYLLETFADPRGGCRAHTVQHCMPVYARRASPKPAVETSQPELGDSDQSRLTGCR